MVPLTSLWVPILLSAVIVFVASAVLHMLLPFHRKDYGKVAAEADVMNALRPFAIPPGDYVMPLAVPPARMDSPEMLEKMTKGPVVMMTVLPLWQMSIWFKRSWGTTLRATIDGLIYGMLTAGTFGWLWPRS